MLFLAKLRAILTRRLIKCFISQVINLRKTNLCKDIFGGVLLSFMHATLPSRIDLKSLASDYLIFCDFMTAEGEKKARVIKGHTSVIVSLTHSGDLSKRHIKKSKEK